MSNNLLSPPESAQPAAPFEHQVEQASRSLPDTLPTDPTQVMIALDIDGTIITTDGVRPRMRQAIDEAIEAGINVVIATGRGRASTRPVIAEIGFEGGYSVSSNGAETLLWEKTRDGRHVYTRLREWLFDPTDTAIKLQDGVPGVVIGVDDGGEGILVSREFAPGELLAVQTVTSFEDMVARPTTRIIARASHMNRDEFSHRLDAAGLTDVEYAVGWTSWADITARGATKARGLSDLAAEVGLPREGTIAVGDGDNDIPMLKWAAHGVAMGGAGQKVRASADADTGPVEADGAAAVIEAVLRRI